MARIKTTYGKKPKANPSFAASTGLWSSPTSESKSKSTSAAAAVDEITSAIESLDVREKERLGRTERKRKDKKDRALQTIDGNVASPVRRRDKKDKSSNVEDKKLAEDDGGKKAVAPKTPQRVKTLLPNRPAEEAEQTPQSERRRRGKRAIPSISLDDDDDDAYEPAEASEPTSTAHPRRPRAMSSPASALDLPKPPSPQPRSKSPSVHATPKRAPDPLVAYTKPLLRLCADRAGRKAPTPFALWSASLEPYFGVAKIAEASYGEVYRLSLKRAHAGLSASDESVLKMIALKPPEASRPKRKGKMTKAQRAREEKIDGMSSVAGVAGEIALLQRMAHVPGFTNFRDVRVLRGAPSPAFAAAWAAWNDGREGDRRSIFPDPRRKGSYDDDQLWAVVEMQDAGTDLENLRMGDVGGVFGVWDIFWSVTLALGKGEEEARFEHRDLHMGNICIRPANANHPISEPASVTDVARNLGFTGLESTIIDYTLSRAQMTHPAARPDPEEDEIAFLDLELDPAVFEGDADEEYQYEIYRYMRGAMYLDDPFADVDARWDEVEEVGRTWMGFHPQTNLVWLHFILHEMMKQVASLSAAEKKASKKTKSGKKTKAASSGTKAGKTGRRKVVLDSEDEDAVDADADAEQVALEKLVADKRKKLEKILKKVQKLLDPERFGKGGLHSVKDLVALALEEAWLDEEDVIAVSQDEEGSLLELVRGLDVSDGRGSER
ncbi:putative haspin protein kinase protein [Neofusicoccum parvum]|uniref:Haspin protein kinase protein n=1 Tax=Neofusicoccum parvum TaxID=310453 RepID=A0ACB5RQG9_9PEZI|nr:putative haspin protein kinase protein [Neofusicoccum parvum]